MLAAIACELIAMHQPLRSGHLIWFIDYRKSAIGVVFARESRIFLNRRRISKIQATARFVRLEAFIASGGVPGLICALAYTPDYRRSIRNLPLYRRPVSINCKFLIHLRREIR